MKNKLKAWALEELLDKERHREIMAVNQKYIDERQRQRERRAKAISERGIPELDTNISITLVNHKYSPNRKQFPEQAMNLLKAQGIRKVNSNEKLSMTLQYMAPHLFIIFLICIVALLDL